MNVTSHNSKRALATIAAIATSAGCLFGCASTSRDEGAIPVRDPRPHAGADEVEAGDGDESSAEAPWTERADDADADDADEGAFELDPMVIEVDPETGEGRVYDPRSLLDAGNEALADGRAREAKAYFDALVDEFPDSRLSAPAQFNKGLAFEQLGDGDAAIAQYLQLARVADQGRYAIDAAIRAGAVMAELGRFAAAADLFQDLLERSDLSASDRVEAFARLGYVLYENKRDPEAEEALEEALAVADGLGEGEYLETNYYVAMAHFYLGMIPRRQFGEIPLRLPDEQLQQDLDAKAELVLLAHERFSRAIDVRAPDWATAAGYELGAMQEGFWREIVTAPIPPHLSPRQVEIYNEEVHRHALEFLERALNLYKKTVELAEAYRTSTPYSRAARTRAEDVADLLARERAGELVQLEDDEAPSAPVEAPEEADWDVASYVPSRTEL